MPRRGTDLQRYTSRFRHIVLSDPRPA